VFVLGVDTPTLGEATVGYGGQTQQTNWMYAFVCVPAGSGAVTSTNPAGYTNTTPNSVSVTVPERRDWPARTSARRLRRSRWRCGMRIMPIVFRPGP
jgi:hypothetical protein